MYYIRITNTNAIALCDETKPRIFVKTLKDPPQSPLKRGKKIFSPLFKGGWGDLLEF
jgi:hypothetical protein